MESLIFRTPKSWDRPHHPEGRGRGKCRSVAEPFTQHMVFGRAEPRSTLNLNFPHGESGMTGRGSPLSGNFVDRRGPGAEGNRGPRSGQGRGVRDRASIQRQPNCEEPGHVFLAPGIVSFGACPQKSIVKNVQPENKSEQK